MNTIKTLCSTFLALLLLVISTNAAEAQRVEADLTHAVSSPAILSGSTFSKSISGEQIISFAESKSLKEQRGYEHKMLRKYGVIVKEWSLSGKYALVTANKTADSCFGISGAGGNPYGRGRGGGDQVGTNYVVNGPAWNQGISCSSAPSYENIFDYISGNCANIEQLTPYVRSNYKGRVQVAIIDSGVKNLGPSGTINGVPVSQYVVPASCSTTSCSISPPASGQSDSYNSHGKYITQLITGWFQHENLTSKLKINSYKVLDENLKCSVFQVIKAIERAIADENQVISLSLGFIPEPCRLIEDEILGEDFSTTTGGFDSSGRFIPATSPVPPSSTTSKSLGRSILHDVIAAARDQGVIVVTSAGNNGVNLDTSPQFPAAEPGLRNIVTVGALNCTGGRANYSNYSSTHVDLFTYGDFNMINGECGINILGTSFACPLVAAKAALHITSQHYYDMDEVLCHLRNEATPFSGAKYGIVDAGAGRQFCGYGGKTALSGKEFIEAPVVEKQAEVMISPNPFNDRLTVDVSDENSFLTIINARGSRVLQREMNQSRTTFDLGHFKPGVYWVNIHSATGTRTKSIVKQ